MIIQDSSINEPCIFYFVYSIYIQNGTPSPRPWPQLFKTPTWLGDLSLHFLVTCPMASALTPSYHAPQCSPSVCFKILVGSCLSSAQTFIDFSFHSWQTQRPYGYLQGLWHSSSSLPQLYSCHTGLLAIPEKCQTHSYHKSSALATLPLLGTFMVS